MPKQLRLKSLNEVATELASLEKSQSPKLEGAWSVGQVLVHCAQSIEYSLTGYPSARSALFQKTIGRLALRKFLSQGYMRHDLNAPVPRAPELPATTLAQGLARLRQAISAFQQHQGTLAPHFAYGPATHAQYEQVHAMHVANHLAEMQY